MHAVARRSNSGIVLLVVLAATFSPRPAESQTAVTTCGQEVKGDAYLTGDLDCPPDTEAAVQVLKGHLDLGGFTIRGGEIGVLCAKDTDETAPNGDEIYEYTHCSIANGSIVDQTLAGIVARDFKELDGVTVAPAAGAIYAIVAHRHLAVNNVNVQVASDGSAIYGASRAKIEGQNLTMTGGYSGIAFAKTVKIVGITASGYQYGAINSQKTNVTNATLTGGTLGIGALHARVVNSTITGNSEAGVYATRATIIGSTLTGNGTDIRTVHPPKVDNVTCDTSDWGVCAND
jgi:hypothetical protein